MTKVKYASVTKTSTDLIQRGLCVGHLKTGSHRADLLLLSLASRPVFSFFSVCLITNQKRTFGGLG